MTSSRAITDVIPPIESARLRFRAFRVEDAETLFPTLSDVETMRWWTRPPFDSVEAARAYLERPAGPPWRAWYFTLRHEDTALGWVSTGEKRQGGVTEIGYMLGCGHRGQGYAREAVARVIDHLFVVEGQRRVCADTDPDNRASRKLLERLGFQLEGLLRHEWETHIGVRDTTLYGLVKGDWRYPAS